MKNIPLETALCEAGSVELIRAFLEDLLSEAELVEIRNRWLAAQMLEQLFSYSKIEETTGLSSTTIARVSKCLKGRAGGYKTLMDKIND